MPTHIFLSFAKADSDKIQSLKEHLSALIRNQEIVLYSPNDYLAGTNTEIQIQEDLEIDILRKIFQMKEILIKSKLYISLSFNLYKKK